jgi:hypothetical protein
MKTVRFAAVIDAAGLPAPHPLWVAPEKDGTLQRALQENRVMTIHQDIRGTRKDFGTVGFETDPNTQFLIFPRSLREFHDRRIVGIDYELLTHQARPLTSEPPKEKSRVAPRPATQPARAAAAERAPPPKAARPSRSKGTSAAAKPQPVPASDRADVQRELQKAIQELRTGKAVAAYERLQSLLNHVEAQK